MRHSSWLANKASFSCGLHCSRVVRPRTHRCPGLIARPDRSGAVSCPALDRLSQCVGGRDRRCAPHRDDARCCVLMTKCVDSPATSFPSVARTARSRLSPESAPHQATQTTRYSSWAEWAATAERDDRRVVALCYGTAPSDELCVGSLMRQPIGCHRWR